MIMEIARKQLFEFNDMGPMPRFMKSILTDNIQVCHQKGGTAEACAPKIIELLEKSGAERIVDLCSGAGGPLLELERILREEYGRHPRFILTDLFPNIAAAAQINQLSSHIRYLTESVDATKMPRHLTGIRTIFAGFHHMDERLAFHVLASAFKEKQAIFILEIYYKRSLFNLLRFFAVIFFSHFFLALTNRPKWSQLLLTYLFPILPLMMAWDGAISCLRTYSLR